MFIVCGIERYTNILKCPPPHTAEFISSLLRLLISCQLLQNFSWAHGYLGQQAWLLGWRPGCPQTLTGPRYPRRNSRCSTHVYRHVYCTHTRLLLPAVAAATTPPPVATARDAAARRTAPWCACTGRTCRHVCIQRGTCTCSEVTCPHAVTPDRAHSSSPPGPPGSAN